MNGESTNSKGVAIVLNDNFEYNITSVFKDSEGNLISIDINIVQILLKLINLYAPNKDLVLDPILDSRNYKHLNNPSARKILLDMMVIFNLKDTFRSIHPSLIRYPWRRKNHIRQARLDNFLVSPPKYAMLWCDISPKRWLSYSSCNPHVRGV